LDAAYLDSLENEMAHLEGEGFFEKLKKYVLKDRSEANQFLWIIPLEFFAWRETKSRFRAIAEEILFIPELKKLTMRGRFECLIYDLLPPFKKIVVEEISARGGEAYLLDTKTLEKAYGRFRPFLSELGIVSADREKEHLLKLENRGRLIYGRKGSSATEAAKGSKILVYGFDGRPVSVETRKIMSMLPMTMEATGRETAYFRELLCREGRFGKYNVDLTVDRELFFLFLVADSLELKANAFAIEKEKAKVGDEQLKEAIWIVERMLGELLERTHAQEVSCELNNRYHFLN
jgi:hypothetical protein